MPEVRELREQIPKCRTFVCDVIGELNDQEASGHRAHTCVDLMEQVHGLARVDALLAALLSPPTPQGEEVRDG